MILRGLLPSEESPMDRMSIGTTPPRLQGSPLASPATPAPRVAQGCSESHALATGLATSAIRAPQTGGPS